jgi:rfaE bifunctional protein nucleotidyltransferase chain/domain
MTHLEITQNKIISFEQLQRNLYVWRMKDYKVVFTNGCFDILHRGHIYYLSKAADLGDVLIVGINSDASVRRLGKGGNRPIQHENDRALILAAMQFVDAVVIFEEDTPLKLIKIVQPDILVKGGDWKPEQIVGANEVRARGGEVVVIPYVEGYSTTNIEQKIKSQLNQ